MTRPWSNLAWVPGIAVAACSSSDPAIGIQSATDSPRAGGGSPASLPRGEPDLPPAAAPTDGSAPNVEPSDGGEAPGAAGADAASPDGPDAGLEAPDAAPDAVGEGAAPVFETLRARRSEGPVADFPVIVSRADGSLDAVVHTDATGVAHFDVPIDGSITFVTTRTVTTTTGEELRHQVSTLLDVPEGFSASVALGDAAEPALPDPMTVEVLFGNLPAGSQSIRVALLCGEVRDVGPSGTTFLGYVGCGELDTFDTYAIAFDGAGSAIAHARLLDRPFGPGTSDSITLDEWATDFIEMTFTASPMPSGTTSLLARVTGYRPGHFDATARAGLRDEIRIEDPGDAVTRTLRLPSGLFSAFRLAGNVEISPSDPRVLPGFDRFVSTLPASFSLDPGALAVFETLDELDTGSDARPGVVYSLSSTGRLGDAMRLGWSWSSDGGETVSFSATSAPHRSGSVSFPEMPPDLSWLYGSAADTRGTMSGLHDDDLQHEGYASYLTGPRAGDDRNGDSVSAFRTW